MSNFIRERLIEYARVAVGVMATFIVAWLFIEFVLLDASEIWQPMFWPLG